MRQVEYADTCAKGRAWFQAWQDLWRSRAREARDPQPSKTMRTTGFIFVGTVHFQSEEVYCTLPLFRLSWGRRI